MRLFGQDLARLDKDGAAHACGAGRVSLVFQARFHLLPNMTAEKNVSAPLEISGQARCDRRRAAPTARPRRAWAPRLRHYPHQLSGGEQQVVVALARALAVRPALLFADEPAGNLDAENAVAVADMMFELVAEVGAAMVLVTHDPGLAARADRRVTMSDGRVVAGS